MAKPEWGVKRTCLSCGVHYYDMRRDPILCPKCGVKFLPEAAPRPPSVRRAQWSRRKVVTEKTAAKPKTEIEPKAETASSKDELEQTTKDDEAAADDNSVIEDTSDLGEDNDDMLGIPSKLDDDESRG